MEEAKRTHCILGPTDKLELGPIGKIGVQLLRWWQILKIGIEEPHDSMDKENLIIVNRRSSDSDVVNRIMRSEREEWPVSIVKILTPVGSNPGLCSGNSRGMKCFLKTSSVIWQWLCEDNRERKRVRATIVWCNYKWHGT